MMLSVFSRYLVRSFLSFAVVSSPALADPDQATSNEMLSLLDSIEHALHSVSYSGIFTYEHAGIQESVAVTHTVDEQVATARYEHLTGKLSRPLVHRSDAVSCGNQGRHQISAFSRENLNKHYSFRPVGYDRIAGRDVLVVNADPADEYRFRYQIAVDRQTSLPLLMSVVDGQLLLERFQFVKFEPITDVPVPVVKPSREDYVFDSGCLALAKSSRWRLTWLPSGFRLISVKLDSASDLLSFSDGLSRFSVVITEVNNSNTLEGEARRGGTFIYLDKATDGTRMFQVSVVGEVPEQTLKRVAASIRAR